MVESLQVGPYSLPVVPLYGGPLLEAKGATEPLATLLNHAIDQPTSGLAEAIESGREGSDPIVYVSPAGDENDDGALRAAWAARTGEQLGPGSVARVGQMGFTEPLAIPWAVLRDGLTRLRAIRAAWRPEPGPWLFVRPARRPFLTPEDHKLIRELEAEAAAIDQLDLEAEVGQEPPTLISRRREFLTACCDAGVFAADHAEVREQWLYSSSAGRLLALRRAALELTTWGRLPAGADPTTGPVCLDYVRLKLWPPGDDGEDWARRAIKLLSPLSVGDQGVVVERVGGSETRVWWRRDGDQPGLLAIAPGR
jgi:hypothetical protein